MPSNTGRPTIGPTVNVRLSQDLIDRIDKQADAQGISRAAFVRQTLDSAVLNAPEPAERLYDPIPGFVFSARVYAGNRLMDHFSAEDPDLVWQEGHHLFEEVLRAADIDAPLAGDRRTSSLTLKYTRHQATQDVVGDLMDESYG
jgi:hypothetical protein